MELVGRWWGRGGADSSDPEVFAHFKRVYGKDVLYQIECTTAGVAGQFSHFWRTKNVQMRITHLCCNFGKILMRSGLVDAS